MKDKFVVREVAQVRALTGPMPHRLVSAFERMGQCTVGELSDELDEPAESLYYHVRRMVGAGVLRQCGVRPTSRRDEAIYELPGKELVFDPNNTSPAFLTALGKSVSALLRLADRAYGLAIAARGTKRKGGARNLMIQQHYARLGADDLTELNRRLEDIADFIQERDDPTARPWVSLTMALSPVARESRKKGRGPGGTQ